MSSSVLYIVKNCFVSLCFAATEHSIITTEMSCITAHVHCSKTKRQLKSPIWKLFSYTWSVSDTKKNYQQMQESVDCMIIVKYISNQKFIVRTQTADISSLTLVIELQKSLLVLAEFCPCWHLINFSLQCCNFSISFCLKTVCNILSLSSYTMNWCHTTVTMLPHMMNKWPK